ncbi:putative toxin-antitoxin system, antitoxin component [Selenomonas sp. CM52]|nr:putative toxin-antitoxin system, antitoxin component [Selenomonas sp. CM52]
MSDDFVKKAGEIPWKQIKGQRNIFAHGYDTEVDFSKVWVAVEKDIPALRAFCVTLLLENDYKLIKLEFVAKRENVKE